MTCTCGCSHAYFNVAMVVYLDRKGETEHIKLYQLSGLKSFLKQFVSAWLSISVLCASLKMLLLSSHVWQKLVFCDEATPTQGQIDILGVYVIVEARTDNKIK